MLRGKSCIRIKLKMKDVMCELADTYGEERAQVTYANAMG
jgi:hypothetical protein